jgi:hypothetical protein
MGESMTRFKSIGLALVAVFAMSAVVASAASAQKITTLGQTNVTLTGSGGEQKFTAGAAEVKCTGVTGTTTGVQNEQAEVTVAPVYTGCTLTEAGVVSPAIVHMNGCAYVFTSSGTVVHIECPANQVIKVTAKLGGVFVECLDIHAQTPTTPSYHLTNGTVDTKMDFTIVSTVSGVTYERTGLCKKGEAQLNEANNANYVGSVTVTCEKAAVPVDCTAS